MKRYSKSVKVHLPSKEPDGWWSVEVKFVTSCHSLFHNCQHLLLVLSPVERCFLDFLAEKMDNRNWVPVTKKLKSDFRVFLEEVTSNEMSKSERTLETYLKKFVDLKLLIRSNEVSGGYFVNPKYMFKGTLKERERVIKGLFEKAANGKVSFEPLLDKPISEYFDDHEGKLFAR